TLDLLADGSCHPFAKIVICPQHKTSNLVPPPTRFDLEPDVPPWAGRNSSARARPVQAVHGFPVFLGSDRDECPGREEGAPKGPFFKLRLSSAQQGLDGGPALGSGGMIGLLPRA